MAAIRLLSSGQLSLPSTMSSLRARVISCLFSYHQHLTNPEPEVNIQRAQEAFYLTLRCLQWGPPHSFADLAGFVMSNKNFQRQFSDTVILQSLTSFTIYQWLYSIQLFPITKLSPVHNKIVLQQLSQPWGGHRDNKRWRGMTLDLH